jgi:iron-sulfur cluster assembly protein
MTLFPIQQADVPAAGRISISAEAVAKMKEFVAQRNPPPAGVRIGCAGGDAEGLSWSMSFETAPGLTDIVLTLDGLQVFVDTASATFLSRFRVDYEETADGAGFTFEQPAAAGACSCSRTCDC